MNKYIREKRKGEYGMEMVFINIGLVISLVITVFLGLMLLRFVYEFCTEWFSWTEAIVKIKKDKQLTGILFIFSCIIAGHIARNLGILQALGFHQ